MTIEVSDWTIIEITLAVMGIILIPVIRHFWKSDISKTKQLTLIESRIHALERDSKTGAKVHDRMEEKIDDICNRLARMEGRHDGIPTKNNIS